jgi:hypothetical protein
MLKLAIIRILQSNLINSRQSSVKHRSTNTSLRHYFGVCTYTSAAWELISPKITNPEIKRFNIDA